MATTGRDPAAADARRRTTTDEAALERAVRAALARTIGSRATCSGTTVPAWATRSTRGPALAALGRRRRTGEKRGIRVRLLSEQLRDHLDHARSLLHAGDSDRARIASACGLTGERQAGWAGGQARTSGRDRAPPPRQREPVRRLEGERLGLSRAARRVRRELSSRLRCVAGAAADRARAAADRASVNDRATTRSRSTGLERASGHRSRSSAAAPGATAGFAAAVRRVRSLQGRRGRRSAGAVSATLSDSPLCRDPQPLGPGSFWYPVGAGPRLHLPPETAFFPATRSWAPGQRRQARRSIPAAIAASVADRLALSPGRIRRASPRRDGAHRRGFVVLARSGAERRGADGHARGRDRDGHGRAGRVEWRFGDGARPAGGPGVPYRSGPPPEGAVVHVYETRCLPGDQGRNPYVLASCGPADTGSRRSSPGGSRSRRAGRSTASGTLPTRTTATAIAYPVSEARAFLVPGAVAVTGFLLGLVFAGGVALIWAGRGLRRGRATRSGAPQRSRAPIASAHQPASFRCSLWSRLRRSRGVVVWSLVGVPVLAFACAIGGAYAPFAWAGRRRERRLRERERAWPAALAQLADALEAGIAFPAAVALVARDAGPRRCGAISRASTRGCARAGWRRPWTGCGDAGSGPRTRSRCCCGPALLELPAGGLAPVLRELDGVLSERLEAREKARSRASSCSSRRRSSRSARSCCCCSSGLASPAYLDAYRTPGRNARRRARRRS